MLENPLLKIKSSFIDHVEKTYDVEIEDIHAIKLENPPKPELGDIGIGCFPLAKLLKRSPAQIAAEIASSDVRLPYTSILKAEGPYLNITIDPPVFIEDICKRVEDKGGDYGKSNLGEGKQVMVEYSAPNTNKPQHLGHVRNNVLGMAVSNILEAAGYDILRVNLVNDRGIHICKSMLAYERWGQNKTPESEKIKGDHFVGDFYVLFEQKTKKYPELSKEAYEMLQNWEKDDADVMALWKKMNDWVLDGFKETYDRLGCKFDEIYMESDTYKLGKKVALDALERGIVRKNEKGEIVVDLEEFEMDEKVLLRKDGTSIYITQDLGTTVLKFEGRDLERAIWVVASEQNLHFKILFHVLEKFGYDWADKCYHLNYGMVYLPEGKMKSREGRVIDADNLMDGLHDLALKEVKDRSRDIKESELEMISEAVGLGALKYYILKVNPHKDINFMPEESVSFDGATGPYAQYSFARLSSILRRGIGKFAEDPDYSLLGNPEEVKLALLISQYPLVIREAASGYNPARITAWIFDISKAINKFHHDHSVLSTGNPGLTDARGELVKAARQTLGNSLKLLGITRLQRM
ncbi:MAG: arginine--tRNA ligase [bacterium]|nr:arginine--tRNA ligase [bacterium]